MTTMIRKQIYLEPDQNSRLKHLADVSGVAEAELIRQAIDLHLRSPRAGRRNLAAWEAEKVFMRQRTARMTPTNGRTWTRDDLHER